MNPKDDETPRRLGYRIPAEWEPHAGTWLTWPQPGGVSFRDRFDRIQSLWTKLAGVLSAQEQVHINYFSEEQKAEIEARLHKSGLAVGGNIFLHPFPAYEPWCRDHGPIFITRPQGMAVVDWDYNAWGEKYPPWDLDNAVPRHVADVLKLPVFSPGMILEGGSIDVNGEGTLLTTESCLLNPNRNPSLSRAEIEVRLRDYLGVEKVLWLGNGLSGDDTDGHVDDLTRFIDARTVVTIVESDPADDNYQALLENRGRLEKMTTAKGEPLRIVDLPTPGVVERGGRRLPASYANFYIANGLVVMPTFDHANDSVARSVLQRCFPKHKVVMLSALDLIVGCGAFHCVTQQQPQNPS